MNLKCRLNTGGSALLGSSQIQSHDSEILNHTSGNLGLDLLNWSGGTSHLGRQEKDSLPVTF